MQYFEQLHESTVLYYFQFIEQKLKIDNNWSYYGFANQRMFKREENTLCCRGSDIQTPEPDQLQEGHLYSVSEAPGKSHDNMIQLESERWLS